MSAREHALTTPSDAALTLVARSLGLPGRAVLGGLFAAGVVIAAPSGFGVFWFVPFAGVGTLLAIRRPGMSIGWLLLGIGWSLAIATTAVNATQQQFLTGTLDPVTAGVAVITSLAGATGFLLFATLAIVFPSGHLPGGSWGLVARIALLAGVASLVASAVMPTISVNVWGSPESIPVPNPAAVLPDLPFWNAVTPDTVILPVVALLVGASIALVVRFRRATGVERQQLRWFTTALTLVVVAVIAGFILASLIPGAAEAGVVWLGAVVAFPTVPIAVGIAILRYRLYEIDRIISRTIGWAVVTGVLVAVFAGAVIVLQAALEPFTNENTLAVAASTLVAFALFQPVRRRVQRSVDRRFDRARYDGERVVASFAGRLRGQIDLDSLETEISRVAYETVRPQAAAVWLRNVHDDNAARVS